TAFTGAQAAFLASFDSNGVRRWATYYSGNGITPPDPFGHVVASLNYGTGVAVDSAGNVILLGLAGSAAGIATSGAYKTNITGSAGSLDVFITKFSPSGSRLWATYFGGGTETGGWVAADVNNNIYFTANTQ